MFKQKETKALCWIKKEEEMKTPILHLISIFPARLKREKDIQGNESSLLMKRIPIYPKNHTPSILEKKICLPFELVFDSGFH